MMALNKLFFSPCIIVFPFPFQGQLSPELAHMSLNFNPFHTQEVLNSSGLGGMGGATIQSMLNKEMPKTGMDSLITDSDLISSSSAGEFPSEFTFR